MLYKYLCLSIVLMSSLVIFDRTVIYVSYMYICCLSNPTVEPFPLSINHLPSAYP